MELEYTTRVIQDCFDDVTVFEQSKRTKHHGQAIYFFFNRVLLFRYYLQIGNYHARNQ